MRVADGNPFWVRFLVGRVATSSSIVIIRRASENIFAFGRSYLISGCDVAFGPVALGLMDRHAAEWRGWSPIILSSRQRPANWREIGRNAGDERVVTRMMVLLWQRRLI
jgi:hypothetical protein